MQYKEITAVHCKDRSQHKKKVCGKQDFWISKIDGSYICTPTRYTKFFNDWVLFITYVSSTCFGPHRSIIRSVLYKLYLQTLVCGTTVRTTRHVQLLRLDVSSSTRITTYQICKYSLDKTLLMMDRWGPKHVELKLKCWLKLTHWDHIVYLVGLHIYIYTRIYIIPTVFQYKV